jgi:hypothetical protein
MPTRLVLVLATLLATSTASADAIRLQLEIPERPLVEGAREELRAIVTFDAPNTRPLLVTPASEGDAIEVVRGRLLRADAEDEASDPLVFRIPIVARAVGTATLRVRVRGYVCTTCPQGASDCRRRCRSVIASAEVTLRVTPGHEAEKPAALGSPRPLAPIHALLYIHPVCRERSPIPRIDGCRRTWSSRTRSRSRRSASSKKKRRARSSATRAPT